MQSLLDLQQGETVRATLPVRDREEEGKYISFAPQKGTVKKTPLKDFSNVMARGIIAIGIDADDELVAARITDGSQIVFLATRFGMAIRFDECDIRSIARPAFPLPATHLPTRASPPPVPTTPPQPPAPPHPILPPP